MASNGSAAVESASTQNNNDAASSTRLEHAPLPSSRENATTAIASSSPVELSHLPPSSSEHAAYDGGDEPSSIADAGAENTQAMIATEEDPRPAVDAVPSAAAVEAAVIRGKEATRQRATSEAIGPQLADDTPTVSGTAGPAAATVVDAGPAVLITIFLINGNRHPFRIDQRYLRKRNVAKEGEADMDPYTISIYTLKELIWRDWRDEWDPRPTNPGAIRLIYFGKLLDDKQTLRDAKFINGSPNVVHMTVKPQEFMDDEENAKGEPSSSRGGNAHWDTEGEREAGCCCRCSVM